MKENNGQRTRKDILQKKKKTKNKTVLSNKHILKILNFRIVSIEGHFVNMHQYP